MKLNLFLLSAIAMVNATNGTTTKVDLGTTASNFVILSKTGISTVLPSRPSLQLPLLVLA
jgi:hypothetical protein